MSGWELWLLLGCGLLAAASPVFPLCMRDLRREMRRRRRRVARRASRTLKTAPGEEPREDRSGSQESHECPGTGARPRGRPRAGQPRREDTVTQSRPTDFYETAGFWVRSAIVVVALASGLDMLRAAIMQARGSLLSGPAPDWTGALDAAGSTLAFAAVMLLVGITFARNAWRERRWRRVYAPLLGQFAIGELEPLKHRRASNILLNDERVRDLSRDLHELCRVGTTPSRLEHALDVYHELLHRCDSDPLGSHGLLIVQVGLKIRDVLDEAKAPEKGGAS